MLGLGGFDRFEGRLGFDWASWENEEHGVSVDMTLNEFVVQPEALGGDAIRDFYIETEAASGTRFNDFIQGTNVALPDDFNELSNVNLINGLANYFPEGPVAFSDGNILFGGGGSDFIEGRAGNDILDGDARLHVELLGGAHAGAQIIREIRYDQANAPILDEFGSVIAAGDIDTAVFSDTFANYQISFLTDPVTGELVFGTDGNPALVVTHIPPAPGGGGGGAGGPGPGGVINDGIDSLYNMERLQFADVTIENPFAFFVSDRVAEGTIQLFDNGVAIGAGGTVAVGDTLTFDAAINDFEGVLVNGVLDEATAGFSRIDIPLDEMTFQWQYQEQLGVGGNPPTWIAIEGATGLSFTPGAFYVGTPIRVVASFTDGLGVRESIVSAPTAFVDTNPNINHAPTVVTQVALPGLPDTSATEDTPLGTATRPGIFLPLTTVFTDDQTPSNQLVYTATLMNGDPLETVGLTFTVLTDAAGLVTGGRVTGTPSANLAGPIEVLVKATDAGGLSVTDDFIINVLPVNDGPGDLTIAGTPEQGSTLTALLGPDPDGPGTTPVFQWLRDGVAIAGTNATSYTLTAADVGHAISARASYVDGQGFSEVVTSTPTDAVTSNAAAPVVVALAAEAVENEPVVADLLAGAADANGDPMSIVDLDASVVTAGGRTLQLGTDFILDGSELSLTAAGLAQFDSLAEGTQDSVTFNFGVSDGTAATPNTLTLTINGVNDAPATSLVVETGTGAEDTAIAGVLLPGTDAEGDTLTFSLVAGSATNGEVTINPATGEYVFTPAASFAGTASFSYVVNDGSADSAVKTVSLDVTPVNDGAAGVTISGDARLGETLTAVLGADPEGAGGPASYQWLRDGVAIGGATGSTLLLSADDVDHVISVNASYTDGQGFAEVAASAGTAPVGTTITGTNAANLLTGTGGDDTIDGLNGNDVINGLGGDDHLIGGAGIDTLDGGDGADTLDGGAAADVLHGGAGNDLLIGGAAADAMFGEDGDDVFVFGFGDGADVIDGGAGFDTVGITGTAANDVLNVTFDGAAITNFEGASATGVETFTADLLDGVDTLNYAGSAPDLVVDLSAGTASGFTSIAGIENVTGGTGSDTLTGDGGDNTLNGGAGASADTLIGGGGSDTLIGGGGADALLGGIGADTLNGGGGNDLLTGGADNDTIDGGAGNGDIAIFAGAIANYTFLDNGAAGFVVTDNVGTDGIDTLLNVESLQFTDGVFTLAQALEAQDEAAGIVHIHDSTPDDGTITGQVGSTLTVTVDHDYDADDLTLLYQWQASSDGVTWTDIEGATGTDFTPTEAQIGQSLQVEVTYDFVDASYGPDEIILSDEVTTPVIPGAELLAVTSNAISGAGGNNHLRGTADDDLIDGGAGADILRGGAGDDVITGGAGRDLLFGDDGDDFLIGGADNDFLNVSRGNDVVVFNSGDGHDVVFNFDATPDAAGDQDMIDLTGYGFLDLAAFQANVDITGSGCHTTITIGEDSIELIGVNHHNVTVDDFYF
jgi:Ca2+-binding RTX toxin-like protein